MRLFKKLYDLEKDNLKIEMPLNIMEYGIYKDGVRISLSECNKKTQEEFLKVQNEYRLKLKERWKKLEATHQSHNSFESLSAREFTMSEEIKDFLMPFINDDNLIMGIHRVGSADISRIQDMLNNGVELTGHGFNVAMEKPDIGLNFGIYPDNRTILKEIANANDYKNSNGSIIIGIPFQDFNGEVYVLDEYGNPRINPKYIIGYFPVNKERNIDTVIFPSRTHDYNLDYYSEMSNIHSR